MRTGRGPTRPEVAAHTGSSCRQGGAGTFNDFQPARELDVGVLDPDLGLEAVINRDDEEPSVGVLRLRAAARGRQDTGVTLD